VEKRMKNENMSKEEKKQIRLADIGKLEMEKEKNRNGIEAYIIGCTERETKSRNMVMEFFSRRGQHLPPQSELDEQCVNIFSNTSRSSDICCVC
jgi:hypothetical protein